jgi:outer membrane receptor for ferrienterochelin and colicins
MRLRSVLTSIALTLMLVTPNFGQSVTDPPQAPERRTYLPDDFTQFAPRTALDMLSRVPGFSVREEDDERGLGEASGNVLINGQRVSGKSNDILTELSRIPAQNVERIEIVDAATLSVPGLRGQVANVFVRATRINGQWSYRPEFRSYYTDPLFTRFEVSLGGVQGPVEYSIGLSNRGNRSGAGGPTWIRDAAGTLIETRDEVWRGNSEQPRLSGRFTFDAPGTSTANLNLLYGRFYFDFLEEGTRVSPDGGRYDRLVTADEHGHNYEIGADYALDLGPGRLKLIGLGRGSRFPSEVVVINRAPSGEALSGFRSTGVGERAELIGRSEYQWTRGLDEWQISGEAAYNSLDATSRLFEMDEAERFNEIPLPGGSARVEEDRYQVIGSWGRPLTPTLAGKISVGGEYSQLSQVGAGGLTRNFYRPKGEASLAWKASPQDDLNFKLARRVGQLDFFDFLASVNIQNDQQNAANPDLVPEQSWALDAEWTRALGPAGSVQTRLYGRLIDDIIDYIPIDDRTQAPGNLDRALVYGIETVGTLNLDRAGWSGARVDLTAQLQESEVEDPLTGETRNISSSLLRSGSLSLRHDVPRTSWAWGGGAQYQYRALSYRLTEVGRMWEGPVWLSLYLENKDVRGLTVRAQAGNILGADSMWDRTVHAGRRTDPIAFTEERDRRIGPIFSFQIGGKF